MSTPGAGDRVKMRRLALMVIGLAAACLAPATPAAAQGLPALTGPVTDVAGVIDPASAAAMDRLSRALLAASGDVVVVATVPTVAPYADAREYAVKLFENGGRGIGARGKDNGLLILLAVKERQVRVEVGYDLEGIVTDGFSGDTSREQMVPYFRQGEYGPGLLAGMRRLVSRIATARGASLGDLPAAPTPVRRREKSPPSILLLLGVWIAFVLLRWLFGHSGVMPAGRRGRRGGHWGGGGWSGWSGGVGGFGGGGGGGGFGGGFGGFGGGSSGGGGGGASW